MLTSCITADFSHKVALITGSSRGIGRACALKLSELGATVVLNYKSNESAVNEVVSLLGLNKYLVVQADVSKEKEVKNMFAHIKEKC